MCNMCVSSCRCCVLVFVVHPVAIIIAVVCVICSLLMFGASGHHGGNILQYGFVCGEYCFLLISPSC